MTDDETVRIHATSVALGEAVRRFGCTEDVAVLILGEPGAGKSDLALRLIAAGGCLIADDQTILRVLEGVLHAECPKTIEGLFEIRGAGIVRLEHAGPRRVALAVKLEAHARHERLPSAAEYRPPPPLRPSKFPPLIALDPMAASAAAKVAAAAAASSTGRFVAGAAAL
jgi:serine kinase of HPr protein (carbohydrate metabolism regulator)